MKISKEFLDKKLKNTKGLTLYSPENIPFHAQKEPYISRDDGSAMKFDMDCHDLYDYCKLTGLCLTPGKNNKQEESV